MQPIRRSVQRAAPTRTSYLPFAVPEIGAEEIEAVTRVLQSGWITTGPEAKQFESEFARAVGVRHAVAVNSCTAAMHLALEAIGLSRGDEVITTPYTFAATAEVIRYFGARPVFVDIDPVTFNINPDLIGGALTKRTKAIIPVHVAGLPAELDQIRQIARDSRIPVIEDAAHAFPSAYRGAPIGSISEFTCFSFYATKTITTAEGGMLCTNDAGAAARCRIMSLHGISKDAWKRYTAEGTWYYEILEPGFKYNLTDLAAAVGLSQLHKADRMLQRRHEIAARYNEAFGGMDALQIPPVAPDHVKTSGHLYMLRLNLGRLSIDRAGFLQELKAHNIGASVHFIPLHVHPYYRQTYGFRPEDFPCALREYQREVSLPIYSKMADSDVDAVIDAVTSIVQAHSHPLLVPVEAEAASRR